MWPRAFAGIIAGFLLAAAVTGLLAWLPPGVRCAALDSFTPCWCLAAVLLRLTGAVQ